MSIQLAQESSLSIPSLDSAAVQKASQPGMDNRDASARMLALCPVTAATCRHFRNQVPREIADELRDSDPEPCYVCDTLPHRRNRGMMSVADYSPI